MHNKYGNTASSMSVGCGIPLGLYINSDSVQNEVIQFLFNSQPDLEVW